MEIAVKDYTHNDNKVVILFVKALESIELLDNNFNKECIKDILTEHDFFSKENKKGKKVIEIKGVSGYKNLVVVSLQEQDSITTIEQLCTILENEKELEFVFVDTEINTSAKAVANFKVKGWSFDKYITEESNKKSIKASKINVSHLSLEGLQAVLDVELAIAEGTLFAGELMNEPANNLYPKLYVEEIKKLTKLGVKVEILDKKHMEKLGMGCLLGVAQGSANEPYVAIMKWQNSKEDPIALVGKGVTFDTGGISIKPSLGMEAMKFDMGGSATVCGIMKSLALRNAKVNVVGLVGLVENMPSSTAIKPGDIVKAMNGKTVEVVNTDAEGRLVLADVLYYAYENFNPKYIIDFATLTGAMIISLGSERAGFFTNDSNLAKELEQAGKNTKELLWHLPLGKEYDKHLKSDFADYRNISKFGRGAGSIVAAKFLEQFVGKSKWAHVDIAGVAGLFSTNKRTPVGFGIKLINDFLISNYE